MTLNVDEALERLKLLIPNIHKAGNILQGSFEVVAGPDFTHVVEVTYDGTDVKVGEASLCHRTAHGLEKIRDEPDVNNIPDIRKKLGQIKSIADP